MSETQEQMHSERRNTSDFQIPAGAQKELDSKYGIGIYVFFFFVVM